GISMGELNDLTGTQVLGKDVAISLLIQRIELTIRHKDQPSSIGRECGQQIQAGGGMRDLSQDSARDVDSIELEVEVWIFPEKIHARRKRGAVPLACEDQGFKDPRDDPDVRVDLQVNLPSPTCPGIEVRFPA